MPPYVVAGVTGRVGSVVASELLAQGEKVRALVRDSGRGAEWSRRGAEIAVGSLEDPAFLAGALRGAAGFFTLLPEDYAAPDFHGARRRMADSIAAAVKESGVPHVVMISSLGADLAEGNGPVRGLHYLENALRATGTKLTALRACYLQENIANVLAPAQHAGIYPNLLGPSDVAIPMVATRDVGRLAARLLRTPPVQSEVVDLLGPEYSPRQLSAKLGAALGKELRLVDIPAAGRVAALTQAGVPQGVAEAVAELFAAVAAGRIAPRGDRRESGATTIDELLPALIPS